MATLEAYGEDIMNSPMCFATDYSTSEKIIGTWIDGSPLYQKTIDFGALPNAAVKSIAHGISNIDKIVEISGIGIDNNTYFYQLGFVSPSALGNQIQCFASKSGVTVSNAIDRSSVYAYITLRYTKTA